MSDLDRIGIASRLRALFAGQDDEAIANRIGVGEGAVRASVSEQHPHPPMEVLVAVVGEYGIDPTWLLTGEYDVATHRHSLEEPADIPRLLSNTLIQHTPPNTPAVEESLADAGRRQAWLKL